MTKLHASTLAAIRRRHDAATKGRWVTDGAGRISAIIEQKKRPVPLFASEMPLIWPEDCGQPLPGNRTLYEQEACNARFVAEAHNDILALLDHAAELKHECERLQEENENLWAGHEALRNTVLAVRNKMHAKAWGTISNEGRLAVRNTCDDSLRSTQPRAWKATHRDDKGVLYKRLFSATDGQTGERVAIFESLGRGRFVLPEASFEELPPLNDKRDESGCLGVAIGRNHSKIA